MPGSGLGAQIGVKAETTYGTPVTVDRFYEFVSESLERQNNVIQSAGLRAGSRNMRRGSRRVLATRQGGGDVVMEVATTGFGLWFNHMLGGTPSIAQQEATDAYLQTHAMGALAGKSLTVQKGVPQTDETSKPFTFHGCKIPSWQLQITKDGILQLTVTLDAEDVATDVALASPSYAATKVFHFGQGALTVDAVAVAAVTGATIAGDNKLKTDRYYLGNSGLKKEPLENDFPEITGTLDAEFVSQATFYDRFSADSAAALVLSFVGDTIEGAYDEELTITIPEVHFLGDTPKVSGPDVIVQAVPFEGAFDGTNAGITIEYQSSDTAI